MSQMKLIPFVQAITLAMLALLAVMVKPTNAFVVQRPTPALSRSITTSQPKAALNLVDPSSSSVIVDGVTNLVVAEESWRQYVPLVVSVGVIIDILLGSPLANMALKPMKGDDNSGEDEEVNVMKQQNRQEQKSRERVDSEAMAKAALDKANSTLELRKFLDERKTDWDKMEDIKRQLDSRMQEIDEDLQARDERLRKEQEQRERKAKD